MIIKRKHKRVYKGIFALIISFSWLLASWPGVLDLRFKNLELRFPQEIQEVQATHCPSGWTAIESDTKCQRVFTSGTSLTIPDDWTNTNTIEVIGGGGGAGGSGTANRGGSGGGAGAYTKIVDTTSLSPSQTANYAIGAAGAGTSGNTYPAGSGGDTFLCNSTSGCSSITDTNVIIGAKGGQGAQAHTTAGTGGAASSGVPSSGTGLVRTNGGNGGAGSTSANSDGGGGGGAGGQDAAGGNGGTGTGGAGNGGQNGGGTGGSAGNPAGAGGNGTNINGTVGSGGGGGGGNANNASGGNGGNYGGAGGGARGSGTGGSGIVGLIVITYVPEPAGVSFTLSNYRWYQDNDALNPVDAWGQGLAANTAIVALPVANDPPEPTRELRLRVNMTVNGANLSASDKRFKLQYKQGTDATCTTDSWTDVGAGGGGVIWRYATSSVTDGTTLTGNLLSSDVLQVYVKANPSALNPNSANQGQTIEYDFHIEHNGAVDASQYSFRVVETGSDGTATTELDAYTNCPTLVTRPGTANFMRHGNFFVDEVLQGFFWTD